MKMKPVTNPMLVGAMELLKAENTPEHRKLVMEEILHARFLSPVIVDPVPVPDENGVSKITPDSKIQLPMLNASDGKHYFMAYTDMGELQKWNKEPGQQIFGFTFKDYVGMMASANGTSNGVVVNPFGNNLIISKEMIDAMLVKNNNPQV